MKASFGVLELAGEIVGDEDVSFSIGMFTIVEVFLDVLYGI